MKIIKRLRSALWRIPVEEEVREELAHHLDLRTRELMADGLTAEAARAEAERRFGNLHRIEAQLTTLGHARNRSYARRQWLDELAQDITFAIRQYRVRPSFTAAAVVTLALGIGTATAIFSVVHAVILRPFPFDDPDRVLLVNAVFRDRPTSFSVAAFDYFRRRLTSVEQLAASGSVSFNLAEADAPERVRGARVTWNYFAALGVRPAPGRAFTAADDRPGAAPVAMLSEGLWQRRFGGDPSLIGRAVWMNGTPYDVIGIVPASFAFSAFSEDVFVPSAFTAQELSNYDNFYLNVYGRRRSDASLAQVNDELARVAANLAEEHPTLNKDRGAGAVVASDFFVGNYRVRLFVLLGAVSLILVIACANVANLLLAGLAVRTRELAVRAALGAGRGRIVRQLLTESLVLSALSGVAGVLLAYWLLPLLVASAPSGIPRLGEAAINRDVLLVACGLTLATTLLIGVLPAWQIGRRVTLREYLSGGKGAVSGALTPRTRQALLASQAALVLVVLAGAALLVRSAIALQSVPLGFDTTGVLSGRFSMPEAQYRDFSQSRAAAMTMLSHVQSSPGVAAAALDSQPPLMGGGAGNGLIPEGRPFDSSSVIISRRHIVTPDYFRVLEIPLTSGRGFSDGDLGTSPLVMVISSALARAAFGDADPIGQRIYCCEGGPGNLMWKTVIGVVGDVRPLGPAQPVGPEFYLPLMQAPESHWTGTMSIVVRAKNDGSGSDLAEVIRRAVSAVDPTLPVYDIRSMDEGHRQSMAQGRFNTLLMSALGLIGLFLAALGIYGVVAWVVSQRTKEIGVRMALGAPTARVVQQMTRQALAPVCIGLAIGLFGALGAGRVLEDQLFGVSARDPFAFAIVVGLMMLVAIVAALIPARRAARIDPSRALHEG
jgi:putative ABC transport system permease protein